MKKNILFYTLIAASLTVTSCIDEVTPTSGVTQEQVDGSLSAKEAVIWGVPAYENAVEVATDSHYDWGYGSIMHIRDVMTEDMAIVSSSYDWYTAWSRNVSIGKDYASTGFVWVFLNKWVQTANKVMGAIDEEDATTEELGLLGVGHAFRAFIYLDLARMYEFLPNDATEGKNSDGNDVTGLTVPIVTENTTEEQAKNNPRATHQEMYEFILADLDKAEELIPNLEVSNPVIPDLGVVYGLKARLYMWDAGYQGEINSDEAAKLAQYGKAKEYARKAIDQGYTPMNKSEWLSTTSGFNTPTSAWMLSAQAVKENDAVTSGILNWTSWMSNETTYGYAQYGPKPMVGKSLYDKINDLDFRKLSWQAPEDMKYMRNKNTYVDPRFKSLKDYVSLKFRPGMGNFNDYSIGSAVAYPMMRVEEMYFIEAEAAAQIDAAEGKKLVEDFMREYRYDSYTCRQTSQEGIIEEIFLQKRIELWGEGQVFFDYKRLNHSVVRDYEDTNFSSNTAMNTETRPAWMNFVIVRSEEANNAGVKGWNNPDPSGKY